MKNYPDLSNKNYEIIRELGRNREGGRVSYLAINNSSHEQVVIKQFRFFCFDATWQGFKVYEREVDFLKQLNHPRIPKYIDSFETHDGFCLIQEYKDAPSLGSLSNLPPEIIKNIAISVLEILEELQIRKPPIIHRDLKPENILVDEQYNAYLIDFGLAKIPDQDVAISSIAAGTPGFMPPEEVFNRNVTKASDLYSLGVTLVCLLTRTSSTEISTLIDDNYRINFQDQLSRINPLFIQWLTQMIEPNFKQRFPDAITALNALKSIDIHGHDTNLKLKGKKNHLSFPNFVLLGVLAIASMIFSYLQVPSKQTDISSLNHPHHNEIDLSSSNGQSWFKNIKPHCNSVEVVTFIKNSPPLQTTEGIGYAAACYALAGKITIADRLIEELPTDQQHQAASIVFNIGHPVADAGDDESAGPIMNLVVKYQPSNYMALYHAGMSAYILGDWENSQKYLESFLLIYQRDDGWRNNAITVLKRFSNHKNN